MRFLESHDDYAGIAPFFDAVLGPFMGVVQNEVRRKMERLRVRNVLDICCGTGSQVRLLADSGLGAFGIDRSPAMLEVAGRKSRGNIPLVRGDARSLPFRDGAFEGALISLALHENEPEVRDAMIREATRILRPQGILLVVDYLAPYRTARGAAALGVRGVEWMAGKRHYKNFRDFVVRGGLIHVLQRRYLNILHVTPLWFGVIGLAVCRKVE